MMINSEQQKSEEEIIKNGEFCDNKNDNEKKKLLFKLINEIIIGNFSSFEEIKEDFILINIIIHEILILTKIFIYIKDDIIKFIQ